MSRFDDPDFFSDKNMNAIGVDASPRDYGAGPNETREFLDQYRATEGLRPMEYHPSSAWEQEAVSPDAPYAPRPALDEDRIGQIIESKLESILEKLANKLQ